MELRRAVTRWLGDGKAQGWSPRTIQDRQDTLDRYCWWLEHEARVSPTLEALAANVVRDFLAYAREANPQGRFGCQRATAKREARPATVNAAFRILRAFSNFCLAEGLLKEDPLKNVKEPRVPKDQVKPLDAEQVQALVDAARRTKAPERDVALILMLVDTGMRVTELIGLQIADVDRGTGELTVTGKGNKKRTVYMGVAARRALWRYMETDRREVILDEPLFVDYYLGQANCCKSEAARLAGYACPGSEGHRLYKEPEIREAIEERLREVAIGADEILARLSEQARANMADFVAVEEGGGFRIDVAEAERAGKLRLVKKVGYDQKGRPTLELHDAQSALLALAKRYHLFPDRQEVTGADGGPVRVGITHAELLEAAREPLEPEPEVEVTPEEMRGAVGL